MCVSNMNAAFILGTVLEVHLYGTLFATISIGWTLYAVVSAHLFVPIYRRMEFASVYGVSQDDYIATPDSQCLRKYMNTYEICNTTNQYMLQGKKLHTS